MVRTVLLTKEIYTETLLSKIGMSFNVACSYIGGKCKLYNSKTGTKIKNLTLHQVYMSFHFPFINYLLKRLLYTFPEPCHGSDICCQ